MRQAFVGNGITPRAANLGRRKLCAVEQAVLLRLCRWLGVGVLVQIEGERQDVLEKIRLGDVSILLVSPEQFRNQAFTSAIAQREVVSWVFDEAHCLSKWGHDFRTDYMYVTRYIREHLGRDNLFNKLVQAWSSALKICPEDARGLVHIPVNGQYSLERGNANSRNDFFHRVGYLSKVSTKRYGDGGHAFGCSRG